MNHGTYYQPPVDQLLSFGDCYGTTNQWHDYIAKLGLNSQHIPDLMRMAVDNTLGADSPSQEVWAPVHAWRALAQLGAQEAIEPLMKLFHEWEDNDWVAEEMPKVYGTIATSTAASNISNVVVCAIENYLAEPSHGVFPRITSVNCLEEIGKQSENARSQCVDILTKQLKLFSQNPIELNGFIVASLIELQGVESASIIYSAFVAQAVPEDIVGSWDDVQQILGVNADDLQLVTDAPAELEVSATDGGTDVVTDVTDAVKDTKPEIADASVESQEIADVVETVAQISEEDVTPTPTTDTTPEIVNAPAELEVNATDGASDVVTDVTDAATDTTPEIADASAESQEIADVVENVAQTSEEDVTPTSTEDIITTTDTTPEITDAPVESQEITDVVEVVPQTSEKDVTPTPTKDITTTTDITPEITDAPVESQEITDVVEVVPQTSEEDVTPAPTEDIITTTDTTPEIADAPVELEVSDDALDVPVESESAESPTPQSSTQKTEIEENKGFGTNVAKKKSKTSRKKKR